MLIGELDGMILWATDIGNAYLEAVPSEKICIRAGPEFGKPKDTCLLSTRHYTDYVSVESSLDSYCKNAYEILDSNRL